MTHRTWRLIGAATVVSALGVTLVALGTSQNNFPATSVEYKNQHTLVPATSTADATLLAPASTPAATTTPRAATEKPSSAVKISPKTASGTAARGSQIAASAAPLATASPAPSAVAQVEKVPSPYTTPPLSVGDANTLARNAIVNIICTTSGGSVRPISGSGIIIDPRGVVLTNAHVAQYVLLSESPSFNLSCTVRAGSPAKAEWKAMVLYIPAVWVEAHAKDINAPIPMGTGEHDYALLFISDALSGNTIPANGFPYLPIDTREAIGFPGDQVLVASYPVEFLDGLLAFNNLYAASSEASISKLLTFGSGSVDLYSLGSVIEAQSGSSGGAVVNPWGRAIGLIVTTSAGTSTAQRDLHALTLSYIERDFTAQTGSTLENYLAGDLTNSLKDFFTNETPGLIQQYADALSH